MQSVKIVNGFLYAHNNTMHLERIDNKEVFVPFILFYTQSRQLHYNCDCGFLTT